MATVTDPIILDSTGQDIVTALNNLNTPRDTAAYTTSFASSDTDDASATSWTVVSPIAGGETHATLFGKLSQIAKNVRFLYKTLGNTDLSAIWANSDSTQSFAAQNVSIQNLTDYDYFVIEFRSTKNRATFETCVCMADKYTNILSFTSVIIGRRFTVDSANGYISFENGFTKPTYGNSGETPTSDVLIPSRIFGRKCL